MEIIVEPPALDMSHQVLRLSGVIAETGLSKSTIYLRISEGTFPGQFALGSSRSSGWLKREIDGWVQLQVDNQRRKENAPQSNAASPSKGVKWPVRPPSGKTKGAADRRMPQ